MISSFAKKPGGWLDATKDEQHREQPASAVIKPRPGS